MRKETSFWLFFTAKEVPFLEVRLRKEDVCRHHLLLNIYSFIQCFFSRYDKYDSYNTFHLNHQSSTNNVLGSSGAYSHSKSGRPKVTWKQLTERIRREWKLSAIGPHDRDTWRSGVRSAMRAASHLPGRGP